MKLRDYQKQDLKHYLTHSATGNFSEQRTGKTPPVCVAIEKLGYDRNIIICPASLTYVWKTEFERWTRLTAIVVDSTSYDFKATPKGAVLIINYEKVRGGGANDQAVADRLAKWKPQAVVLDEAHRIKNKKSLTFKAVRRIRNCEFKVALTGTPAPNKQWDVWGILNWLYPKTYSSYWKFLSEYFEEEVIWIAGKPRTQPTTFKKGMGELLQMNLDINCIQHKRAEVMDWAYTVENPTQVQLQPTKQQIKIIDELTTYYEYKHIVTKTILDNLTRIRQVCSAPEILDFNIKSPKLEWLVKYLQDFPEKSILVFSNSRKLLELAKKYLDEKKITTATICGGVAAKTRQDIVNKFQAEKYKVLLLQTQAAKEGLTLDQADVSIFLDTYPPAADYEQAKDRMVATVPERNKDKEIIHVMMKHTYDEQLYKLVEQNVSDTAVINNYKNYTKLYKERRLICKMI